MELTKFNCLQCKSVALDFKIAGVMHCHSCNQNWKRDFSLRHMWGLYTGFAGALLMSSEWYVTLLIGAVMMLVGVVGILRMKPKLVVVEKI
jgi:hypothetical protein